MHVQAPAAGSASAGTRPPQSASSSAPALTLDRVIGISSTQAVAHPSLPGALVYLAGGTAVLYDCRTKQQLRFFQSKRSAARTLTCLAFSKDGGFLAAGERAPTPELLVWEVATGRCVQALKGHKLGIVSIAFSQDGKHGRSMNTASWRRAPCTERAGGHRSLQRCGMGAALRHACAVAYLYGQPGR